VACLGSFTALLPQEAVQFLELPDVESRVEFLESLYDTTKADRRRQGVEHAWDAMHRCLCDGWLDAEHGEEAQRACVIGGRQLSDENDWIISYVEPALVKRVSAAIEDLTREWFEEQYYALQWNPPGEGIHRYETYMIGDLAADFEYTWDYFVCVQGFYQRAATRDLATVFKVDQ
jgi:hypothetical protein